MSPTEALTLLSSPPVKSSNPTRWADLGCGSGLFTLALASLLPPGSTVYAVDREPKIRPQLTPSQVSIEPIKIDFVKNALPLRDLDGILMANSLHYVKDKPALIRTLRTANLRPQHAVFIVEYDTDRPTPIWVPYPISFHSLGALIHAAGYATVIRLADHPSIYHRSAIYSAYIA
jgi:trans-aconitate methyltransferase